MINMKRFAIISVTGLIILALGRVVNAADTLTAFQNTIEKLEISRDGGKTYFTVFENSNTSIDLVAINGQSVGTFIGNALVPAGTYNYSRVRVSDATLTFTVNDEIPGHGNGTITITKNDMPAGSIPRTETGTMSVKVSDGGTVNGVINFDAATSYSGLTYIWKGGAAPNQYTLTGLTFAPNITVVSE